MTARPPLATLSDDGGFLRLCSFGETVLDHGSQNFGNTPGLRKTSAGTVRRIAVENLGNVPKAGLGEMSRKELQPFANLSMARLTMNFQVRVDKRTEQPCPDGSLVIRTVSGDRITFISSTIPGIRRRQAAQARTE